MSAGAVGKDVFEDLETVLAAINDTTHPGARESLERLLRRTLTGLAVPGGDVARGLRQGITTWQNVYVPIRDPERGK